MEYQEIIINAAIRILADNLGSRVAEIHKGSFTNESPAEIVNSVQKLLSEIGGPYYAIKQTQELSNLVKSV